MKKMMAFFAIVIGSVAAGAAAPIELHVSPSGNDSNPGTREKPLATPAGARDALRRMRAAVADARERVPPDSDARERVPPDGARPSRLGRAGARPSRLGRAGARPSRLGRAGARPSRRGCV